MTEKESTLLAKVRLAIGTRPDIMAFRVNTGVFRPLHGDQKRAIRSAPNGTPDLIGTQLCRIKAFHVVNEHSFQPHRKEYHFVYGQAFAIETKTAKGAQRKAQEDWQTAFERVGGLYILARSVDDVIEALGPADETLDVSAVLNSHRQPVK